MPSKTLTGVFLPGTTVSVIPRTHATNQAWQREEPINREVPGATRPRSPDGFDVIGTFVTDGLSETTIELPREVVRAPGGGDQRLGGPYAAQFWAVGQADGGWKWVSVTLTT